MTFSLNDRVQVAVAGMVIDSHLNRVGIVRGFSRDGNCVWVQWENRKTTESWSLDFLRKVA